MEGLSFPLSPSPSTLMQWNSLGPIKGHLEDPKSSTKGFTKMKTKIIKSRARFGEKETLS